MKFSTPALIVLWLHLAGYAEESPPREILQAEIRELRTVVETLREENRLLNHRNERLMEDIRVLGRRVRALNESDKPEPEAESQTSPDTEDQTAPTKAGREPRVIYVNPTWHYLLIDAGVATGLAAGDTGRVVRGDTMIGTVEITDAKTSQSVADLQLKSLGDSGVYPRKGDEVRFK